MMTRLLYGHDVPNWAIAAMTFLTILIAEGFIALVDKHYRMKNYNKPDRP